MFERVSQYEVMNKDRRLYRPRAYASPRSDGRWEGWLVFFPLDRGQPIASGRETTQPTRAAVALWAAGLGPVYLDGALGRALALTDESAVLAHLEAAENEALEDAEQLETSAAVERAQADVDEAAAEAARQDATRLHHDRARTEAVLAAAEEVAAPRRADRATAEPTRTAPVARKRGTRTRRNKRR